MIKNKFRVGLLIPLAIAIALTQTLPVVKPQETVPNGPWIDQLIIFKEPDENKMYDYILKGEAQAYHQYISTTLFEKIKDDPRFAYDTCSGIWRCIDVNPQYFTDGSFNPFTNARIREALNYIVDRQYIAYTVLKGTAKPKTTILITDFPDYCSIIDVVKQLEKEYSYNPEKARSIIYEEMGKMGAVLTDGKWNKDGKPVVIKFMIRTEDERRTIGDLFANELEKLGFTIDRIYGPFGQTGAIRYGTDSREGRWHLYTAGYSSGFDEAGGWWGYYIGHHPNIQIDPAFYEKAAKLAYNEYSSIDEKIQLMKDVAVLSLKHSTMIQVEDKLSVFMKSSNLQSICHLGEGVWTTTFTRALRLKDTIGGTVKISYNDVFTLSQISPFAASGVVNDMAVYIPTLDQAFVPNPYANEMIPVRVSDWSVSVVEGIPVKQLPNVQIVDSITVPADAIAGWDPVTKKYATVGRTDVAAKAKVTLAYDTSGKFHDGTEIGLADFMVYFATPWERSNPASELYDEDFVTTWNVQIKNFLGMKIIRTTNPITVEIYTNFTNFIPSYIAYSVTSYFNFPWMPWHAGALGILGEAKKLTAWGTGKAAKLGVELQNYMYGPTIPIFENLLSEAKSTKYVPEWIKEWVREEDIVKRYEALENFYKNYGHFVVGSGQFILSSVDPVARQAILKANRDYPYKADRFAFLLAGKGPSVTLKIPDNIVPGLPAEIEAKLTSEGKAYPNEKVERVIYILSDAEGNVLKTGKASSTPTEGTWKISCSDIETSTFTPGALHLTTYAFSTDIAVPGTGEASISVIPVSIYLNMAIERTRLDILSDVDTRIGTLSSQLAEIDTLTNKVASLENTLNMAMGISAVSIIIAIVAVALSLIKRGSKK
jgi:peptide/nickel transport system substrate-binding protein